MKPSLQLRQSLQLTMTPQLQQAIRLLQLSSLELSSEIQSMLTDNPMLEQPDPDPAESGNNEKNELPETETHQEGVENISEGQQEEGWDRYYDAMPTSTPKQRPADAGDRAYDIPDTSNQGLQEHLYWQLNLTPLSARDNLIAEALIDSIDDEGYLLDDVETIQQSLPQGLDISLEEVEMVLHRIQRFDPLGVGSRDLRECLLVQLSALDQDTVFRLAAIELVDQHLNLLGDQNLSGLKKVLGLGQEDLLQVIRLIQTLEPRPGNQVDDASTEYITPDVYVKKQDDEWAVLINDGLTPPLKVNQFYADMIESAQKDDAQYMKSQLQEAKWFIKSLETRNDTVLRVALCIVKHQQAFLEKGPEYMKPLVLKEVAEQVDLHESTISRVTNRKYMHTPRGIFEFKHFFSSHVSTADGEGCSAVAIQAMIQKLVDDEPPAKPLSDSKLAALLNEQGIQVARRTVAKYREALNIPSSTDRKRLI